MVDEDIGRAKIVYEDPHEGTTERTVDNEHVAYFQDHWIVEMGDDGDGTVVRRIPSERVYYVERSVEEFQDEVDTLRNQVESFADDVRAKLLGGGGGGRSEDQEVHHIEVTEDTGDDEDN